MKQLTRQNWMDFAKFAAIVAVLTDHSAGLFYSNSVIQRISFYSVSLFVLLSGYGLCLSHQKKAITFNKQLKKIGELCVTYMVANFIGQVYYKRGFDLELYIDNLIHFNLQGPYYYFMFYFQLLLIAPVLLNLCDRVSNLKKGKSIMYAGFLIGFTIFSWWSVFHTKILGIYGGGGVLFGGSYLLLFWIGIVLAKEKWFEKLFDKHKCISLIIAVIAWAGWNFYSWKTQYAMDVRSANIFGSGINPPGIYIMVSALLVMIICYNMFGILENVTFRQNHISNIYCFVKNTILYIGRNTLYIFLYHLMAQQLLKKILRDFAIDNKVILGAIYIGGMLLLPLIVKNIVCLVWNKVMVKEESE